MQRGTKIKQYGNKTTPLEYPEKVSARRRQTTLKPLVKAIALALAAGGVIGNAHAQQAFSSAWFANKGVVQSSAIATGKLPNGTLVSSLNGTAVAQTTTSAQAQTSLNNLNLAARAIAQQQALQAAARQAALNAGSGIPDGLTEGGLVVDSNSLTAGWINANAPTQSVADATTTVTIEQTAQKAILNWETFNVGKNTQVYFNQSAGTNAKDGSNDWIALNRVNDPNGRPSQIAGQIKAEGSVYIINRNGIIFSGSSQINTRSLVASSLALTNDQFNAGINNPFMYGDGSGNDAVMPVFGDHATSQSTTTPWVAPDEAPGDVVVEAGADLNVGKGGKLMLFGSHVSNAGQLSAVDGQIILAAGEQIWLAEDKNGVRGLDVAVSGPLPYLMTYSNLQGVLGIGTVYDPTFINKLKNEVFPAMDARAAAVGYQVSNTGSISSERGNVTLQSREVNQDGVITASTALNNLDGSIRLRAWGQGMVASAPNMIDIAGNEPASWSAGTLALGEGSVTLILPDASDTSEIEATSLATRYTPGSISLDGKLIDLQANSLLMAPSGTIDIVAAAQPLQQSNKTFPSQGPSLAPGSGGIGADGSRIYLDSGAVVSVAGLQDVTVDMARNFVEVDLRINELRDSPLLRDSWLRGQKLIVDRRESGLFETGPMSGVEWIAGSPGAWVGTPLADVAAWLGVGKTDLQELSATGGQINVKSGGDFITRAGSLLDVSGGSVRYTDGWNTASKLQGADGGYYTMANATSDIAYSGIAGRYINDHARWDVSETYASPLLAGKTHEAGYSEGRNAGAIQIYVSRGLVLDGDLAGGVINGERQVATGKTASAGSFTVGGASNDERGWLAGKVIISDTAQTLSSDFTVHDVLDETYDQGSNRDKTTWIGTNTLADSAMGDITLYVANDFTLEAGSELDLAPKTSFSVIANTGQFDSTVFTLGGSIRSAGGSVNLSTSEGGSLVLAEGSRIDVSGQWLNELRAGPSTEAAALDGGSIALVGLGATVTVAEGVVLDVSGGGRVRLSGKKQQLKVGDAGSIRLAGFDAEAISHLDMAAYAAGSGGSLLLNTDAGIQIGGGAAADGALLLPADLYAGRGFRSVAINAGGNIDIADGTQVSLLPLGWDMSRVDYTQIESGTRLAEVITPSLLPAEARIERDAAQLSITSQANGDIRLGVGASIRVDTRGSVSLSSVVPSSDRPSVGTGEVSLLGSIDAPAGTIEISSGGGDVTLAAGASLLARGVAIVDEDAQGLRSGQVLDGGKVSIEAASGNLTLAAGSLIDVSGTSGVVDYAGGGLSGRDNEAQTLASDGGSITIAAGGGLIAGSLNLSKGGESASDGRFALQMRVSGGGGDSKVNRYFGYLGDPRWYGFEVADGAEGWEVAVDFDWNQVFQSWGIDAGEPIIITRADAEALLAAENGSASFVVSDTAAGGVTRPAAFALSLSETALDFLRDNVFGSDWMRELSASPAAGYQLTLRPAALVGVGSIELTGSSTVPIAMDDVNLSASQSILLNGPLAQVGKADSTLSASYIRLAGSLETPVAVANRVGKLVLQAAVADVAASSGSVSIRGFAETQVKVDELRFTRDAYSVAAVLDVDGALTITAGQIYPATAVAATILSGESIKVLSNGESLAAPLSAGGSLTLSAPLIEQGGVLLAPFGSITLNASERLVLGAGSLTSVSGDGLLVPYGSLGNNEYWLTPYAQDTTGTGIAQLPDKRITLQAPVVDTATGAVVDIRGGGDLYANEFVAGAGGSHNMLALPGAYAVMPGYASAVAPGGGSSAVGSRIWLAGGNGLAAGWYTLLPASYAALPGAYLVMPTGGGTSLGATAGQAHHADGSVAMVGHLGNALNGAESPLTSYWQVMTGTQLRQYSEYNEAKASEFFATDAFKLTQYRLTGVNIVTPRLSTDAGSVVFKAGQQLVLDATLLAQAGEGGRGGLVDIVADKIAIVGAGQDASALSADNFLVIDSAALTEFSAGSLLIGGSRYSDPLGTGLDVASSQIVVRNDAASALSGSEIILAASDAVTVEGGSVIQAAGSADGSSDDLIIKPRVAAVYNNNGTPNDPSDDTLVSAARDWGSLLRVSNAGAVQVKRQGADSSQGGLVSIGEEATLSGGQSLLIDATRTTELASSAKLSGAALSIAAGRIGIGGGSEGLVLGTQTLTQLAQTKALTLRSYSSIDFYADLDFSNVGLTAVVLDAARLAGYAGDVAIDAKTLTLVNSGEAIATSSANGAGQLHLAADQLVLGQGAKGIDGFATVELSGRERIVAIGDGTLDASDAALALKTPVLTGEQGASLGLVTTGQLSVSASEGAVTGLESSLGAALSLTGGSITVDGRIVALGGSVALNATSGDLVLADASLIDVGGFAKDFFDVTEYANAGRITLEAGQGNIRQAAGSTLNLAAHKDGGNAGTLSVKSGGTGDVDLAGHLLAQAGAAGLGGNFALNVAALSGFGALNARLNEAGFSASRNFRVRSGDVTIDGSSTVADFALTADQGQVILAGSIDARSTYGGRIEIAGGNGVTMTSTASLQAGATDTTLGSGRVTLQASGGQLDLQGGTIDVSGGEGGRVRLRAQQNASHNDIAVTALKANIVGARSAVLEGVAVYNSGSVDAVKTQAITDVNTFTTSRAAITARLGAGNITLMPGIEIRSTGDLTLDSDWNLFETFGSDVRQGGLTLRAAGNLLINANLSDGFSTAGLNGVLQDAASWDLRLVAGADLSSASATALQLKSALAADSGSLTVGDAATGTLVRTGTGDLEVSAGRDLKLANESSALYTAGRADNTVWGDFSTTPATLNYYPRHYVYNQPWDGGGHWVDERLEFIPIATAAYGIQGGNLTVAAQGNVEGIMTTAASSTVFDWLLRMGRQETSGTDKPFLPSEQSTWFVDYAKFNQGVGALGGGNVAITSGGNIDDLLVAQPTNGRVRGGRTEGETKTLELRNGGVMNVTADGAIRGGQYYLGRGAGRIEANTLAVSTGATAIAPVLALGDTELQVTTAQDLAVATVIDPLIRWISFSNSFGTAAGSMSGYTDHTVLDLLSVGGDLVLGAGGRNSPAVADLDSQDLYPAITHMTAFNGSINNEKGTWNSFSDSYLYTPPWTGLLFLMPGKQTELRLLAEDDIRLGMVVTSRITPEAIPSPMNLTSGALHNMLINASLDRRGWPSGWDTDVDWLADDFEPSRIYARSGSIERKVSGYVSMGEQVWIRAGQDIRGLHLDLRNNHASDVSLIEAGNDISSVSSNPYLSGSAKITIQGPGSLVTSAGRDVYNINAISYGNYWQWDENNRPNELTKINHLPDEGASITVMAGLNGQQPDYAAFQAAYLDPAKLAAMPDYLLTTLADGTKLPRYLLDVLEEKEDGSSKTAQRGLVSYIKEVTGETLAPLAAWTRFASLPELAQQVFVRRVFQQELREAGRNQNEPGADGQPVNGGYNRGYAAIAALFPGDDWAGDVVANSMTLRTNLGGDISVLTPGGGLQVASLTRSPAAGEGIVTLAGGHIGIFADENVTVNRSRVLAFVPEAVARGSDMIIWSTDGDVDAGRGAKTLRVPSKPLVETDVDGITEVIERSDMSGSGIGTIGDGDVDLIAPEGTINAGDAGIRVAGNLNLAAMYVLNAENIDVKGKATGIPVVAAVNIGALTNASAAAAQASAAAQDILQRERSNARQNLPSIFSVRVLGFGSESPAEGAPRNKGDSSSILHYNPAGVVQILGAGALTSAQMQALTETERRALVR